MVPGRFLSRPNRFIAKVEIEGQEETVHVKNTGRCRELLTNRAEVFCRFDPNPARKTRYDLITVRKGDRLINMDSQAPNAAAKEWLLAGGLGEIENLKAESFHGDSRFDFSFTKDGKQCFLEVKGVTLENDGVCAFPDAPTERGIKHINELVSCISEGYEAYILFVIQMKGVNIFVPNDKTNRTFGEVLRKAEKQGVKILAVDSVVKKDSIEIDEYIKVNLDYHI